MTVLRRTLFRQAGGPAEMPMGPPPPQMQMGPPPQMAQQAPPPDVESQLNAVEQQAAAGGEQAGLEYLAGTMEGIDAAQSFEEVINAMRGNEAPMQERRMELAGYVGDEDAYRTPDSVLAMVQPTILLTEEGAMDSGIGQLMQALSDDVEMMGPEGEPTPVGQGVGELLVQGQPAPAAPPAMPPQMPPQMPPEMMAFNGGPVVKKYAKGDPDGVTNQITPQELRNLYTTQLLTSTLGDSQSTSDIGDLYESYLPDLQQILGDTDELRKRREGLRMAESGFQLMSGRDKAGKNISGRPFLSQVGSALGTYTGGRAKDLEADRSRDLAIKTLAYKQAAGQQQFERQAASTLNQAMLGAAAKNLFDPGDYSISTIANADGSETPVRINKKTGTVATVPMGAVRQDIISFGSGKEGDYIRVFGLESPAYGLGTMNKTNVDVFEQGLSTYLNPVTQEGGVSVFENALPKSLAKTILQRLENSELATNLDQRIINEARRVAAVSEQEAFFEAAENINKAPLLIKPGMEFEQSFDALASVKGGLNNMLIYGASFGNFRPEAINSARIANEAALTTLLNRTRMMFREDLVGKPFASDAEMLLKEVSVLDPSTVFTNSELAYAQAQAMKTIIQKMKADRDNILGNVAASESDRAAAEKMKGPLEWMEDNFENLIKGFTRINGDILRTQKRLNVPVSKPITPVITDEEIVELDGL
jgi:hypothetical protein